MQPKRPNSKPILATNDDRRRNTAN